VSLHRSNGFKRLSELTGDQLTLALEWGREPWGGWSPRSLTKGAGVVDNSVVGCPSREAQRFDVDPAQFTAFLKGTPSDGT